jgi:hypothetical protein
MQYNQPAYKIYITSVSTVPRVINIKWKQVFTISRCNDTLTHIKNLKWQVPQQSKKSDSTETILSPF